MDIGRAIGFVFEDEDWTSKILLGSVITLIPIFGWFALLGYAVQVLRNVKADSARPLPTWDDLGQYFVDGLMFWVVTLIYAIPLLIFACPVALVWLLPALAIDNEELATVLFSVAGLVTAGLSCLALLYGILLGLLTPVLQIRYAETGELGDCLRFGELFRFTFDNVGSIIVSQLLVWGAGVVIGIVVSVVAGALMIIPICGWILGFAISLLMLPVSVWLILFASHLYGQISRQAEMSASLI